MSSGNSKAIAFSAVLHALLLGLVAFFAWRGVANRAEANNLLVMEIVSPPGDAQEDSFTAPPADAPFAEPAAAAEAAPNEPAEPLLRQPDIAPVAAQTFEALKDVPPAPEPEPEPVAPPPPAAEPAPTPTPTPTPTRTPAPTRTPTPAPKTAPAAEQPKVMTADQFRQQVGMPRQAAQRSQPAQTATPTRGAGGRGSAPVRIDTSGSQRALEGLLASGTNAGVSQMSGSEQNALRAYLQGLRANIERVWVLPDSVSEKGEWAEVIVTIEANGRISNVRVTNYRGSTAFRDSILKAVRATRSVGPTPTGKRVEARYEMTGKQSTL